jgi:hypothetical protein
MPSRDLAALVALDIPRVLHGRKKALLKALMTMVLRSLQNTREEEVQVRAVKACFAGRKALLCREGDFGC